MNLNYLHLHHFYAIAREGGHLDEVEANIQHSLGSESKDLLLLRDSANRDLVGIDKDIENAFKLHGQMEGNPDVLKMIKEKLEQLSERKRALVAQRERVLAKIDECSDIKETRHSIEENAMSLRKGWSKASPSMRKRLVRRLVDRLVYTSDGLHAYYNRTAKIQLPVSAKSAKETSENPSEVSPSNIYWLQKKKSRPGGQLLDACASVVTSGGGGATTDAQAQVTPVPHDTIRFSPKSKERIFDVCQPLYSAGCSLREIEQKTGFAKTSIREALTSRGYTLRQAAKVPQKKSQRSAQMRSPVLPFGYEWLDGKLVIDPKEYRVVQKILRLWRDGKSARLIADFLNQQNIPTRMGKRWFHSSVNAVIKRHQQSKTQT